jgi:hypothetical protein
MITKFKKRREDVYTPLWLPVLDFDYVALDNFTFINSISNAKAISNPSALARSR